MGNKISLVNFSHGEFYNRQRRYNTLTAKYIAKFDKVYEYSYPDIEESFIQKNKIIFGQKKGLGLWLWKPYFINKTIDLIQEGEYLFHCDSSSIFIKNINPLIKELNRSGQDMMFFELPLEESNWTMPSALDILNVNEDQRKSNQVSASFFLAKKTKESVAFLREWLLMCEDPLLMLNDHQNNSEIAPPHRYDQSLLSLLAKKKAYRLFRDPSQYGKFPEMYRTHSELRISSFNNSNYKTTVLLLRKSKAISEILKFYTKSFLKKYIPSIYLKITS